ncbi:MAG: TetR/AcrR family transcriptional regulator [Slackia sp.]|nr:TetR/AcrR family transcriptional regulator [Slackia sp.]
MDKRVEANRDTRLRIIKAVVRLLERKNLSDISVTDIVEEAGVARASYYRNYDSKEEVLSEAGRMIIDDFRRNREGVEEACCDYEEVARTFRYFLQYREPMLALHRAGFTSIYEGLFADYVQERMGVAGSDAASSYRASFFAGALFSVYVKWLERGMDESPEQMARTFCSMAAGVFEERSS